MARCLLTIVVLALAPAPVWAGAWPMVAGDGQVILTLDLATSRQAFNSQGVLVPAPARRRVQTTLFAEYGLRDRLTLELKLGSDQTRSVAENQFSLAPSVAVRDVLWRGRNDVVSLALGISEAPAPELAPHRTRIIGETRLYWGHAFQWRGRQLFSDLQTAQRVAPDGWGERDLDLTLGARLNRDTFLMAQSFSEHSAAKVGSRTVYATACWTWQVALMRAIGAWRLQLGGRTSVVGRGVPEEHGPMLALWRRF